MGLQVGRGGGGGATADIEVLHEADVVDPIPILYATSGSKQANSVADVAAIKALTAGVLTIGGVSTDPIDFSGIPDGTAGLTPLVALITTAISATPALDGYSVSLAYVSQTFRFVVYNANADVEALTGNLATAMGFDAGYTRGNFSPKSPSLMLPTPSSGFWQEMRFFSVLSHRRPQVQTSFRSTFISDGTDTISWVSALSNTGAWFELTNSNPTGGLHRIGIATSYSSTNAYFSFNPDTGEITWDNLSGVFPQQGDTFKMSSLMVLGRRGR